MNVVIEGPTVVCPKNATLHTYTAKAYQIPFGYPVSCNSYTWNVYKGVEIVGSGSGQEFSFNFDDIGT